MCQNVFIFRKVSLNFFGFPNIGSFQQLLWPFCKQRGLGPSTENESAEILFPIFNRHYPLFYSGIFPCTNHAGSPLPPSFRPSRFDALDQLETSIIALVKVLC